MFIDKLHEKGLVLGASVDAVDELQERLAALRFAHEHLAQLIQSEAVFLSSSHSKLID